MDRDTPVEQLLQDAASPQQGLSKDARASLVEALEGAGFGLWDWDIVTGRTTYSPVNNWLLGYGDDDQLGSTLDEHLQRVHPDDVGGMRATIEAYLRGETPTYCCEFRVRRKDGDWSWFESRGQIVDWTVSGAPGRMVGTHLDITERKTNEQLRRNLERTMQGNRSEIESLVEAQATKLLEAANAAAVARQSKATFLQSMNHELRTPLNVVIGFSSLLLDKDLTGELPPEIREPIKHMNQAGNRLFNVVQQLLDMSSIERGLIEIRPAPMNLRACLLQECESVQAQVKQRGLDLRPVACDGQLQVLADKARLGQVVNALLDNAIRFTDSGYVQVLVEQNHDCVRIEVHDTGIGIARDRQATIFHAFGSVIDGTDVHRQGTGVGLALCRRLIEAMGGAIGIDSDLGHGSRFWFTLPLVDTAQTVQGMTRH
jgi:PAS domain S-box-containing protein